jgi:plasmid segregation protein ParM
MTKTKETSVRNPLVIAVDSGKHTTKAVRKNPDNTFTRFDVSTKMNTTKESRSTSSNAFVLDMNGEKTLIGGKAGKHNFETSKEHDLHRRATYLSISQLVENGDEVVLGIGCPLTAYFNTTARENYMRFMLNMPVLDIRDPNDVQMVIKLSVDGTPFEFKINQLFVYPETAGFLIKHAEKYQDRDVAVVDIGGLNVNGCVYQALEPNEDTFFTINEGGNIFMQDLRKHLNTMYVNANLQEFQMEKVLKDGFIRIDKEESENEITHFRQTKFELIKQEMKSYNWSTSTLDFVFVGGGSLLFMVNITGDIEFGKFAEISPNAVWENVEGFAEAVFEAVTEEEAA